MESYVMTVISFKFLSQNVTWELLEGILVLRFLYCSLAVGGVYSFMSRPVLFGVI